jgi:membrane protease YdiL (CAAX protease family)
VASLTDHPELPEGIVPPAARQPRWPWWLPPLALLGTFAIATVALIIGLAVSGTTKPTPAVSLAATFVQDVSLIACAVLFSFLAGKPSAAQFGLRPTPFWRAVGWLLVAWVGFFVFSAFWSVLMKAVGVKLDDNLPQQLGADKSTAALVATAVLVCVVAPIAEEFFFRGFFFTALRGSVGLWWAAAITGLVFGLIHFKLEFLAPLAVLGFALCLLYAKTGSLLPCIALHALNNSLAFGVTQGWTWEIPVTMVGALAVIALLVAPVIRRTSLAIA